MKTILLFAGMGGSTEGAIRAGWDVRLAIDGWDKACVAHRRWHPYRRRSQSTPAGRLLA